MSFIGINNIDELLLRFAATAPSMETLYDRYVEGNNPKGKGVFTSSEFYSLLELDPTYEQGSSTIGSYIMWLIKLFKDQTDKIDEDGYKAKQYLETFNAMKRFLTGPEKDIFTYKSLPELYDVIKDYINYSPEEIVSDNQLRKKIQEAKDQVDVVYDDDEWMVVIPESYEASCYWGTNTQWCTASRTSRDWFNTYNKAGTLFIIINKNDPTEKYQYYSTDKDFNDSTNANVDLDEFIKEQTNKKFKNFLENEMIDIGWDSFQDKFLELEQEDFEETFNDDVKYELKDFQDENGNIPDEVIEAARNIIYEDNLAQFEMQSSRDYYTYIDWDTVKEKLEDELEYVRNKIYDRRLNEEGQGKLPFNKEIEDEL
jgi:hypothetical protein